MLIRAAYFSMSASRHPTDSFSAHELQLLVDHLPAMVAYWDANERCCFANRAYEKWFGVAPQALLGREMREFLGPLYALNRSYIEGALAGTPQEFERDIPDPNGGPARTGLANYIPHVVEGQVRGFFVLVADISRVKVAEASLLKMEAQLHVSERLRALATLAAGIGHEFNNPLTAVVGNLQLALEELEGRNVESIKGLLAEAAAGAKRVTEIVQGVRLLAHGGSAHSERVDINSTVEHSIDLMSASIRYRATIKRDLCDVGYVFGSASQLVQVLVNLMTNAVQSLGSEPKADAE
ncbi:MAG: sensor histidine kinase response regulator, partial [Polyangiaceae bacterium]|nr:sensor histidine kinase response regulator [Polyangiaceae bacterium]